MKRKVFIKLIIAFGFISFTSCSIDQKNKIGVMGIVKDEQGNPLKEVSISYSTSLITVLTDSIGSFTIDKPRTLFITFKKVGYHDLSTKINNFSEDGTYNFNTIQLKKISNTPINYTDISINNKTDFKGFKLSGNVLNAFKEPIKEVHVTLTDTITESYSLSKYGSNDGSFHFKKKHDLIRFKKDGFREVFYGVVILVIT